VGINFTRERKKRGGAGERGGRGGGREAAGARNDEGRRGRGDRRELNKTTWKTIYEMRK